MLTTIADYCQKRGVTRQFVYEYIKKGKFEVLELPVFAEYGGERIGVGVQKFIVVPDALSPKPSDKNVELGGSNAVFVAQLTQHKELQVFYTTYLSLPDAADRAAFKAQFYAALDLRAESERAALYAALDEANVKLLQYMSSLHKEMTNGIDPI